MKQSLWLSKLLRRVAFKKMMHYLLKCGCRTSLKTFGVLFPENHIGSSLVSKTESIVGMAPKLSAAAISQKIAAGNRKRAELSRVERELQEEELLKKADKEGTFDKDPLSYIGTVVISLLFLSLPLSEPVVDWALVGIYIAVNVVWNLLIHRHQALYYGLFLLFNIVLAQFSENLYNIPTMLVNVPLYVYAIAAVVNAIYAAVFAKLFAKNYITNSEMYDTFFAVMILLNFVLMVVTGVIPPAVLLQLLRSMINLLKNFGMGGGG